MATPTTPTKEYSNRAKCWLWTGIAVLCYAIPLIILMIIKRDKIFKDTSTQLSFFTILIIVFFLVFAKKIIKRVCEIITIAVFASAICLVASVALQSFFTDLSLISAFSLVGAVLALYPIQIATIFRKNSFDENNQLRKDLTFKDANHILFGIKI